MKPGHSPELEQLTKSIRSFEQLNMAQENQQKMYRYNDALMQSLYSILDDQEADEKTKLSVLDDTLAQYTAAMKELFPKIIRNHERNGIACRKADQFDVIEEA